MTNILYTATGCTRCKIVKNYMDSNDIHYIEKDMKAEGKEEFHTFYKDNRAKLYRGPDGIEFPIFYDGLEIRQGIGASIAYLHSGNKLDGFFKVGILHKEWVDGISLSNGKPEYEEEFIQVLQYLKHSNMKLQIETNGKNSFILRQILEQNLADLVIMNFITPLNLYDEVLEEIIVISEIESSIALTAQFPKYKFKIIVGPVIHEEGEITEVRYTKPDEIAEIAKLVQDVTKTNKNPFIIRNIRLDEIKDERLKSERPISPNELFSYRTAARSYQIFAEIEK